MRSRSATHRVNQGILVTIMIILAYLQSTLSNRMQQQRRILAPMNLNYEERTDEPRSEDVCLQPYVTLLTRLLPRSHTISMMMMMSTFLVVVRLCAANEFISVPWKKIGTVRKLLRNVMVRMS